MEKTLYSFYGNYGEYTKEQVLEMINEKDYKFEYTYGLEYRKPTTYHEPISKEKAVEMIKTLGMIDIELLDNDTIHINEVSSNDMW